MDLDSVADIGAALSSPTRVAILLHVLQHLDVSVGEVARALGYVPSTVSHHVAALERVGLVVRLRSRGRTLLRARADRWRVLRDAALACQSPGLAREVVAAMA